MKNQFFYSAGENNVIGSFSIDKVIRTINYEPGKLVVLLNDFHEEKLSVPGKGKNPTVVKETVYSSIYLSEEDSKRFRDLTEIN